MNVRLLLTSSTGPLLALPDFSKQFILDTDSSDKAIGAVLHVSQVIDDKEKVCAYASRCLSKSERRYCVTRKELLAVVYFVKYFRHYLYGREFLVRTDHSSLRWLMQSKTLKDNLLDGLTSCLHITSQFNTELVVCMEMQMH
jgi:hypothetical protein